VRYPEFLKKGERIGFVAPSFGCTTEPYTTLFKEALKGFENDGYRTVVGPNAHAECGIGKSNTPEACGAEVNDFFINDRCDAIISCGGGETMCEDLPFIDFEGIKNAKPKWYMGYSDNTNLTFTLPVLCDTAAIYGPCVGSFGTRPRHKALSDAFDVMCGKKLTVENYDKWEIEQVRNAENPFAAYNVTEPFKLRRFVGYKETIGNATENATEFSGRLIGGCLDCLININGTPFDKVKEFSERYKEDGIIWFMEACDLNVMSIRRALWLLDTCGWFKYVKGFLIGRPMHYDEPWGDFDRIQAVVSMLGKYNVPIILDLDIGHLPPMMPIISGACADVRVTDGHFEMSYKLI